MKNEFILHEKTLSDALSTRHITVVYIHSWTLTMHTLHYRIYIVLLGNIEALSTLNFIIEWKEINLGH